LGLRVNLKKKEQWEGGGGSISLQIKVSSCRGKKRGYPERLRKTWWASKQKSRMWALVREIA